jgi:2-oxoglutarate/2-oxoacid ferredoxin oxidoreductase subunit alpha
MTLAEPQVTALPSDPRSPAPGRRLVVNDFTISVATRNGSGSQTANSVLVRALFKMGIPVSGKNLYPSNIQGLPTWFLIRVSQEGYTARRPSSEIFIVMNQASVAEDYERAEPGTVFIYADDLQIPGSRTDLIQYALPVKAISAQFEENPKLRTYLSNMVYVGALVHLLGIELDEIEQALLYHFKGKRKPVDANMRVVRATLDWAQANLVKADPFRVEKMNATDGLIMCDGNLAAGLGAIYGGVSFVAWYPITPATSIADTLNEYLPQLRTNPETGAPTYSVIQTEDELAALGMLIGAGWAGARSMTATSGPGMSLMAEFTDLGYYVEVPCVIWDVQRMGPSTGLPTRVSQGDLRCAYWLGHGDTRHVVLLPGTVSECFEFGWRALDLAERLQTPIFVLSDLDLAVNQWMTQPFVYPDQPLDRGKVLTAEDLRRLKGFKRYADVDGDGIGYRTLPGTDHPQAAYFSRGTGHNELGQYSERPEDWVKNMARLGRKFETARQLVPQPVEERVPGAEIAFISFGSADSAVVEAQGRLAQQGIQTSYLRVRALPLADSVKDFVAAHRRCYVVELNTDAQMCQLVRLHVPDYAGRVQPANWSDGLPLTADKVMELVLEKER